MERCCWRYPDKMGLFGKDDKDDDKKERAYDLHDLVLGVVSAVAESKSDIDFFAVKKRESAEKAHPLMKALPFSTFDLDEVEIELKYHIVPLGKDEKELHADKMTPKIKVLPYSEKLGEDKESIQTIKLKLSPTEIKKYQVGKGEKMTVEEP